MINRKLVGVFGGLVLTALTCAVGSPATASSEYGARRGDDQAQFTPLSRVQLTPRLPIQERGHQFPKLDRPVDLPHSRHPEVKTDRPSRQFKQRRNHRHGEQTQKPESPSQFRGSVEPVTETITELPGGGQETRVLYDTEGDHVLVIKTGTPGGQPVALEEKITLSRPAQGERPASETIITVSWSKDDGYARTVTVERTVNGETNAKTKTQEPVFILTTERGTLVGYADGGYLAVPAKRRTDGKAVLSSVEGVRVNGRLVHFSRYTDNSQAKPRWSPSCLSGPQHGRVRQLIRKIFDGSWHRRALDWASRANCLRPFLF